MADDLDPRAWAEPYEPVAEAVVRLFRPHLEAVIHDLERGVIVRAWNPMPDHSRRPGDPSLLEASLLRALARDGVAGPYAQTGPRGAPLSSVSALIAGGRGLLGLTLDRSVLSAAADSLRTFALGAEPRPAGRPERDWREDLNAVVYEWCHERGLRAARLSRDDRRGLVVYLDGRGAFEVRRAVSQLAAILGVSRATVYATLQAARDG